MWNAVILGAALAVYAVFELEMPRVWEEWISMAMAAWLAVSPFVLNLSAQRLASWDNIIVGVLIALFAAWALSPRGQGGEGLHQGLSGH
jgi:SPW repeat